eukprot:gene12458-16711_t
MKYSSAVFLISFTIFQTNLTPIESQVAATVSAVSAVVDVINTAQNIYGIGQVAIEYVNQKKDHIGIKDTYDFIVDIPSVTSISNGWPLTMSTSAKEMFTNDHVKPIPIPNIVGVLGYYSKGKSFIVNNLYNIGRAAKKAGWLFVDVGREPAKTANTVTTKGICGIFTSYEKEISDANLLILDTAGRNAPATRSKLDQVKNMEQEISELRSKERLIDDIITDTSDTVLYVMDEVLNEDQRTIIYMIDQMAHDSRKNDQKLYLIHNFKRIDCTDRVVAEALIQEQIVSSFSAKRVYFSGNAKEKYGDLKIW